jgi:prolyl-tRNA editing enzyme YbaK/EbsC (Cys-tRNA(Pro) deacylase)
LLIEAFMAVSQFKKYLEIKGITDIDVVEVEESTHTAQQAADVHGVPVSNIVKSLLVRYTGDCAIKFALVLVPGDKRLDLDYWKEYFVAQDIRMANADEVKSVTGYSIGGVPPFGHVAESGEFRRIDTYIADGFDSENELVAAAGSFKAVFRVSLERLKELA